VSPDFLVTYKSPILLMVQTIVGKFRRRFLVPLSIIGFDQGVDVVHLQSLILSPAHRDVVCFDVGRRVVGVLVVLALDPTVGKMPGTLVSSKP
jgi:hypothetical protein